MIDNILEIIKKYVHWLYIIKTFNSSFQLSDYSLQWIKMQKMTATQLYTEVGEAIKRIF